MKEYKFITQQLDEEKTEVPADLAKLMEENKYLKFKVDKLKHNNDFLK